MAAGLKSIIGSSEAAQSVRALVATIAPASSSVLVLGESGTGKELIAQALHEASERATGNFVPVNCAAIPKELLESELFGHRKGAFTGALTDRTGRFELAHGGTLFLDEIGDMPADMQVKLLRVLQERVIEPVGSSRAVRVDVRVVAATHRDIEAQIAEGRFREDLYYRLNVLPVFLPPLRERAEDIPELFAHFARRHAQGNHAPVTLTPAFSARLQAYAWPGNIRELSNLVARFSALYPGARLDLGQIPAPMLPRGLADAAKTDRAAAVPAPVKVAPPAPPAPAAPTEPAAPPAPPDQAWAEASFAFSPSTESALAPLAVTRVEAHETEAEPGAEDADDDDTRSVTEILSLVQELHEFPEEGLPLKQRLADIERSLILQALERSEGNVSKTARLLSLQRTTLIEKLNKYDLRLP